MGLCLAVNLKPVSGAPGSALVGNLLIAVKANTSLLAR
jgi:hypothetical protein